MATTRDRCAARGFDVTLRVRTPRWRHRRAAERSTAPGEDFVGISAARWRTLRPCWVFPGGWAPPAVPCARCCSSRAAQTGVTPQGPAAAGLLALHRLRAALRRLAEACRARGEQARRAG